MQGAVKYSISELEEMTGIKAHTLRTWEKRYGLITPQRTANNVRFYTDSDLRRLMNVVFLNKNGHKISTIASMSDEDIRDHMTQIKTTESKDTQKIDNLSMALIDLDPGTLECMIDSQIRHRGIQSTFTEVIVPFVHRMGLLLMSGTIGRMHENLVHEILLQKLRSSIDQIPRVSSASPGLLIFSTNARIMQMYRLFIHYLGRSNEFYVINLPDCPSAEDLAHLLTKREPFCVCILHDMSVGEAKIAPLLEVFEQNNPEHLMILGQDLHFEEVALPPNCRVIPNVNMAVRYLESLGVS